jgi:hypothetical protein
MQKQLEIDKESSTERWAAQEKILQKVTVPLWHERRFLALLQGIILSRT